MEENPLDEEFVKALTASQGRLLAYICCLLGDMNDANIVLQDTNLVLWRKADQFKGIRSFNAWSREVAYFQVLAFLRDRKRDKLVFSQDIIDKIATERDETDFDERRLALRDCLSQLNGDKRMVLRKRYTENLQIRQMAKELNRSEGAIKVALGRIRLALLECVKRRMGTAG